MKSKSDFVLEESVGGFKLRAWSLTTKKAMASVVKLCEGKTDEDSIQHQIVAIAWMQSRPPEDVEQALWDGTAQSKIEEFERNFPLASFPAVAEWAGKQAKAIEAAIVHVVPKPQKTKSSEVPPPN